MRSVNSKVAAEQYAKAVNNIAQSIIQQDNPYHDPKQSVTEINLSLNADAQLAYHNSLKIRKNSLFSKAHAHRNLPRSHYSAQSLRRNLDPVTEESDKKQKESGRFKSRSDKWLKKKQRSLQHLSH